MSFMLYLEIHSARILRRTVQFDGEQIEEIPQCFFAIKWYDWHADLVQIRRAQDRDESSNCLEWICPYSVLVSMLTKLTQTYASRCMIDGITHHNIRLLYFKSFYKFVEKPKAQGNLRITTSYDSQLLSNCCWHRKLCHRDSCATPLLIDWHLAYCSFLSGWVCQLDDIAGYQSWA